MAFLLAETAFETAVLHIGTAYGQTVDEKSRAAPAERKFGDTKIIPSVTLSERYDSNILYAPSGLDLGRKKWDVVTTIAPTVQVLNRNRYADSNVTVGARGGLLVNNPDLNYVATLLAGTTALDGLVNQLIRGGKLQISDTFSFSPENPSFVSAGTPVETDNPFARGIVPVRANIYQNTVAVRAAYPIAPTVSLDGSYSYSLLRVGQILVGQQNLNTTGVFFNTDYHTFSLGPTWRLSRSDNVSVAYKATAINLEDVSDQFLRSSFTAQGAEAIYSTKASDWGMSVSGGATVLQQRVYSTGTLSLSAKVGEATQVQVTGSRQMAPAFFGVPGALISTIGGISVEHVFFRGLSLTGNANYAYNQIAPTKANTFESYTTSALLAYKLTRSITTSLLYSYTYFEASQQNFVTQDASGFLVNRHFVTFSITAVWN